MGEEILRLNQTGVETVRGTHVAANRKGYFTLAPNFTKALREFSDTSGTFEDRRRKGFQREIVTFAATDLLTFQDFNWWAQRALKGGVAGVTDAEVPPAFTWTYVPSLAVDDLKSDTYEWNHVGNAYESGQVMVNDWTINIDPDNEGGWLWSANLLALDMDPTTHTAAIGDRTTEVIPAPGTTLWIDDTAAGIGTTQKENAFISATISGNNQIHFKAFAEHVTSYAPNKVGRQGRRHNATVTMEFEDNVEFAKMQAGDDRFIRFESIGSEINDAPANFRARVDINGPWETISWSNRQGNIIATFGIAGYFNATTGCSLRAEVITDAATI